MSDEQCCKNPIGFVREWCTELNGLVENYEAILDAAGEGPNSGISCSEAVDCINAAIGTGDINVGDDNVNAIGGTYDPASGTARVDLSDGNFFNIAQWPVSIEPVEINNGAGYPTPVELAAAATGVAPGTIIWYQGDVNDPVHVWIVSYNEVYTKIATNMPATPDINASAVYDPPSLADGAGDTTTVAAVGAAMGNFVKASFTEDLQGITVTAWVSAPDVVSVRFQNETGGLLDLNSGTLSVRVSA